MVHTENANLCLVHWPAASCEHLTPCCASKQQTVSGAHGAHVGGMCLQKLYQKVPELEKSTAVAVEKMRLEETARRKLEERLITVSHTWE